MNRVLSCAIGALVVATLACSIFVGGPDYPENAVPASTEALQSMDQQVEQALTSAAETGVVNLELTESQLTSYVAAGLAQQPAPAITEPRVLLRDGHLTLFGKAHSGVLTANISMSMQVTVDPEGQPQIEVTQTDFGPIPVPQGLNDALTAFVREALMGSLGPVATGFRLESITIGDGVMKVSGRIK